MRTHAGLLALAVLSGLGAIGAAPAHADDIRIGLAVPLSGRMASVGLAMEREIKAAIAESNGAGGVLGQQLSLLVEDDGCGSAAGAGAASYLVAQKPALVIGHPCSSAAAAAGPVYGKGGVLLIAVGPRHPDVTRGNGQLPVPVLRLAGRDDRQGDTAARWLLDHAPARRVGIIHDRTVYARGIADEAVAALKAAGVAPAALIAIVAANDDYESSLLALKESGAEAVLFAGYPEEAAIILSGLERIGLSIPLLGSDSLATETFAERAAKSAAPVEILLPIQRVQGDGDGDGDAAVYGAEARGAFEAWLQAAREAGALDGALLSQTLRGAPIATRTLGMIRFDPNGDLDTPAFAAASARAGRWIIREK